jgi:hypothetical protein
LESYEPLWAEVAFAKEGLELEIPEDLDSRFTGDKEGGRLFWRGAMTAAQRDKLLTASEDADYAAAVNKLYDAAQTRSLPGELPENAAGVVRYDDSAKAFYAVGKINDELAKELKEVSEDPAYTHAMEALIASSAAVRAAPNYRDLVGWTLWGGVACMVTSGLLSFAMQWRSALRAFGSITQMFGSAGKKDAVQEKMDAVETPGSWFVWGQIVGFVGLAFMAHYTFAMPVWQCALAVILAFALALVACRVTGETDTTPVGAMGKIAQLIYGGISPGRMDINLMSANITAGAASSSADLLTDLKSGYLLGANPRKQFLAQFSGIFMGTLVTCTAFSVIVPNAKVLGSDQFPAPAAQAWKAVAEVLGKGLHDLHPVKLWSIVIGGAIGILIPLIAKALPKYQKYMPSPAGLGLAWTFHWYYSVLFFVGSILGWGFEKRWPKQSEEFTFPIASGIIAGGSLMGVTIVFWENGPEMIRQLFGGG